MKCTHLRFTAYVKHVYISHLSTDPKEAFLCSAFVAKEGKISTGILREREKIPFKRLSKASDLPRELPEHREEGRFEAQIGVRFVHARRRVWFDRRVRGRVKCVAEEPEDRTEKR